jgi:hypothetical protein
METRSLTIWNGENYGSETRVSSNYIENYEGHYIEDYEAPTAVMKAKMGWNAFRIGMVFDKVKDRVAVFRQVVKSCDDARPTDIVLGLGGPKSGEDVIDAWSTDPQHADPPSRDAPCTVWDFAAREPTEEENRMLALIRRGPPSEAAGQRWREEDKTKQRRAEAEEAVIRLAAKAFAEPHEKTESTDAELKKNNDAPVKANETPSDKLTIPEAAAYARVDERTIYNWIHNKTNRDGTPMLAGVSCTGRLTRIPRKSLEPFRKRIKATSNKPCKRSSPKSRHRGQGA